MYTFIAFIIIFLIIYLFYKNEKNKNEKNIKFNSTKRNNNKQKRKKSLKEIHVRKEKYNNKVVFVDSETTGLSNEDEFIEITAVLAKFDKQGNIEIIEKETSLREPNVPIKKDAQKIHGITKKELTESHFNKLDFINIFKKAHFITSHNASFDRKFLIKEFEHLKNKFWLCSMNDIKWKKRGFKSKGLENLLNDHDIKINNLHRSEDDAMGLINLLNCKASPRTTYFNQLLRNNKIKQKNINFK